MKTRRGKKSTNPNPSTTTSNGTITRGEANRVPESIQESKGNRFTSFSDYERFRGDSSNSINRFTVKVHDMPPWYVHDSFIIEGYRRLTRSWRGCLLSLSYLHNETGNIYTHGIGALLLIPLGYWLLEEMKKIPTTSTLDYVVQFSHLAGLWACLTSSTIFHLCCCHSKQVSIACNKADYVGIAFLQIGSFIPAIYYGFFCDTFYQLLYAISIIVLGLLTIYVTAGSSFATSQYRWVRTGFFTLFGAVGFVPSLHHTWRYGLEMSKNSSSILDVFGAGACYLVGACFYVHRVPERWYPGRFDIIGSSHQVFLLVMQRY